MLKEYARRRMNEIDMEIRTLVDQQDTLTNAQSNRLEKLDRNHHFWKRWS